jgi:hypothetical protein
VTLDSKAIDVVVLPDGAAPESGAVTSALRGDS